MFLKTPYDQLCKKKKRVTMICKKNAGKKHKSRSTSLHKREQIIKCFTYKNKLDLLKWLINLGKLSQNHPNSHCDVTCKFLFNRNKKSRDKKEPKKVMDLPLPCLQIFPFLKKIPIHSIPHLSFTINQEWARVYWSLPLLNNT